MLTALIYRRDSRRGGALAKLVVVLALVFAIGVVAWMLFLPKLIASQIHKKTGFTVKVDDVSVNLFTADVAIKGMILKNPENWPLAEFVDLRELRVDADLFSLWSDRLEAREVVLDIAQLTLVKNREGALNGVVFANALSGSSGKDQSKEKSPKKAFLIKHMVMKFDRLVYADHSVAQPVIREYTLNLNRELNDVDSVAKIINPITGATMGLLTETLHSLFKQSPDILKDAAGIIQGAGRKTGEKLKGLMDALDNKKP